MGYEHKEGSGTLFLEENKRGAAPDYKGSIKIDGKTIKLAAWKNKTKAGKSMLGLQVDTYQSNSNDAVEQNQTDNLPETSNDTEDSFPDDPFYKS